jgi:hypothetical protein
MKPVPDEGVFFGNLVVIYGPGAGLFVYNGTPGLGNLPIFYVTSATTDPFGNPVTPLEVNASTLALIIGAIFGNSETLNPGPFLLYGQSGATISVLTSTGTFTPPSNGTVTVGFIGAGAAGNGFGGGGGGEYAQDSDAVTASTPYTITLDATSTRATFDTKTITAHAGAAAVSAAGGPGGTGSAAPLHYDGGHGLGGGGGAAGAGGPGGKASATAGGLGGPAAFIFPAGGKGGNPGANGKTPGGGGGEVGGTGAAGVAVIAYFPTGGTTALLDSIAQNTGTDPNTGTAYQAGVTNYNPTFGTWTSLQAGGLKGQAGGQTYFQQPSSSPLAFPIVAVSEDGGTYDMTRFTALATSPPVTFASVVPANIPGLSFPVGAGTYRIRGQIVFEGIAAAAGNAKFSWSAGTAVASAIKLTGMFWQDTGGGIAINGGAMNALTDILTSQVLSITAEYVLTIDGWATFTTGGTLQLQAACSNAADTFQVRVNGTYIELLPVIA